MDDVIDDLIRAARRCERAANRFDEEALDELQDRIGKAIETVGEAWSGSWIGYQARVYTRGFRPKRAGEHFDSEWGPPGLMSMYSNRTEGEWAEYQHDAVVEEIFKRAGISEKQLDQLAEVGNAIVDIVEESKAELLPTLDAVLQKSEDSSLRKVRDKIADLGPRITQDDFVKFMMPRQLVSRDTRAMQGGVQAAPHIMMQCWVMSQTSTAKQAKELAEHAKYAAKYLQKSMKMKGKSVAKKDGPIFIGHGRSHVWKDLRQFLTDRLKLEHEEFNREPTPGLSNKERLVEMLDKCPFAFLVMTAEDEQKDGKLHARANVIHEAGLFQGRYGFERAIILLEEGCEEFSNINGIGQIRFPKGDVLTKSEEIRRVLEREGLL